MTLRTQGTHFSTPSSMSSSTLPGLREILTEHKAASARTGPNDPVFVTSAGAARSWHNLRQDVVDAVVARANGLAEEHGEQPS